eukprot:TRINITY_DN8492_c0_g1_i18.p1 TRINITY_DN8492_c0_g1~~TRINITY_DN8492_c0_g1_i18.p1  ORF type:complete len:393 (-),score=66.01 TRINITY_DN8492_c0_g1_i18:131-1309(-)
MAEEESPPVVLDLGSGMVKVGLASHQSPHVSFPSVVGRLRSQNQQRLYSSDTLEQFRDFLHPGCRPKGRMACMGVTEAWTGYEATFKSTFCNVNQPLNHDPTDWPDVETLLHHIFYSALLTAPEEQPLFFTHSSLSLSKNLHELFYEALSIPAVGFAPSSVLSLYASGLTTGLSIDLGDVSSSITPIYEGHPLAHARSDHMVGGRCLTNYLKNLLAARHAFTVPWLTPDPWMMQEWARDVKEKMCAVGESEAERRYVLPDGTQIEVEREWGRCPEGLFRPACVGVESNEGIHDLAMQSILKCPEELHHDLCSNIVLSGGTSLFRGLPQRLDQELSNLAPPGLKINITAAPNRNDLAWTGGAMLASSAVFKDKWVTAAEYQEHGTSIVYRKSL